MFLHLPIIAGSGGQGDEEEVAVKRGLVTIVGCSTKYGVAEESARLD